MDFLDSYEDEAKAKEALKDAIVNLNESKVRVGITNDIATRLLDHRRENAGNIDRAVWLGCNSKKMAQNIESFFINDWKNSDVEIEGGTGGNIDNGYTYVYAFPAN